MEEIYSFLIQASSGYKKPQTFKVPECFNLQTCFRDLFIESKMMEVLGLNYSIISLKFLLANDT